MDTLKDIHELEDLPEIFLPYIVHVMDTASPSTFNVLVFATKASIAIAMVEEFLINNNVSGIIAGSELLPVAATMVEVEETECPSVSELPDELQDPIRQILKP